MRLIDADRLMAYCNNLKDKTIDANDIARFPAASAWISVDDQLPEEGRLVLVAFNADVGLGIIRQVNTAMLQYHGFCGGGLDNFLESWYCHIEVTHWMPIPALPGKEE